VFRRQGKPCRQICAVFKQPTPYPGWTGPNFRTARMPSWRLARPPPPPLTLRAGFGPNPYLVRREQNSRAPRLPYRAWTLPPAPGCLGVALGFVVTPPPLRPAARWARPKIPMCFFRCRPCLEDQRPAQTADSFRPRPFPTLLGAAGGNDPTGVLREQTQIMQAFWQAAHLPARVLVHRLLLMSIRPAERGPHHPPPHPPTRSFVPGFRSQGRVHETTLRPAPGGLLERGRTERPKSSPPPPPVNHDGSRPFFQPLAAARILQEICWREKASAEQTEKTSPRLLRVGGWSAPVGPPATAAFFAEDRPNTLPKFGLLRRACIHAQKAPSERVPGPCHTIRGLVCVFFLFFWKFGLPDVEKPLLSPTSRAEITKTMYLSSFGRGGVGVVGVWGPPRPPDNEIRVFGKRFRPPSVPVPYQRSGCWYTVPMLSADACFRELTSSFRPYAGLAALPPASAGSTTRTFLYEPREHCPP